MESRRQSHIHAALPSPMQTVHASGPHSKRTQFMRLFPEQSGFFKPCGYLANAARAGTRLSAGVGASKL